MVDLQYTAATLSGAWDDALLEPMAELNAGVLEALMNEPEHAGATAGGGLQWQWRALGESARQRLAHCPYLLVDAGFARAEPWARLPRAGVHEALLAAAGPRSPFDGPLLRRILLYAWHLARANRLGARIALGMGAPCAAILAAARLADLDALAEQRPPWIRPRWANRPGHWRACMAAAAEESPRALERLQLWGLQSIAAEVALPPVESCLRTL